MRDLGRVYGLTVFRVQPVKAVPIASPMFAASRSPSSGRAGTSFGAETLALAKLCASCYTFEAIAAIKRWTRLTKCVSRDHAEGDVVQRQSTLSWLSASRCPHGVAAFHRVPKLQNSPTSDSIFAIISSHR